MTIYLDTAAHRQLRMLAIEQSGSVQDLMTEATNDLFQKAREGPDRRLSACVYGRLLDRSPARITKHGTLEPERALSSGEGPARSVGFQGEGAGEAEFTIRLMVSANAEWDRVLGRTLSCRSSRTTARTTGGGPWDDRG